MYCHSFSTASWVSVCNIKIKDGANSIATIVQAFTDNEDDADDDRDRYDDDDYDNDDSDCVDDDDDDVNVPS